jgi:hypothetical protein
MIRAANGKKPIPLPKTLNPTTGKESTRRTEFSDTAWGKATRSYAKSARALSKAKYKRIVEEALTTARARARGKGDTTAPGTSGVTGTGEEDERACLKSYSDLGSDEEYVFSFSSFPT